MIFKKPKIEKLYEAISVLADLRIEHTGSNSAKVYSSDKSKFYSLAWNDSFTTFYSDDNASKWQNTLGYPIIAILLDKKMVPLEFTKLSILKDINWNKINKDFKRDYASALSFVLNERLNDSEERESLEGEVLKAHKILINMQIRKSTTKQIDS